MATGLRMVVDDDEDVGDVDEDTHDDDGDRSRLLSPEGAPIDDVVLSEPRPDPSPLRPPPSPSPANPPPLLLLLLLWLEAMRRASPTINI